MSATQARAFITMLLQNDELFAELKRKVDLSDEQEPDPDTVRRKMAEVVPGLAARHGYEFTADEGLEALDEIGSNLESGELSDDELEQVAGGKESRDGIIAGSVLSAGLGCAVGSIIGEAKGDTTCEKYMGSDS